MKRRGRCGECSGCIADDCGACVCCKDMKKYGGTGRKKKCCIRRKCVGVSPLSSSSQSKPQLSSELQLSPNLQQYLLGSNRKIIEVQGDGNCLFRAVSYLLFGHEEEFSSIRNLITRFENLNRGIFEKRMTSINESTFEEHIRKLCHPKAWATHVEVYAIATYFRAPVYYCVHPPHPGKVSYCWERFMPLVCDSLRYPLVVEPPFDVAISVTHFELVYMKNYHYDCIVSVETESLSTSLPPFKFTNEQTEDILIE